MNGMTDGAPSLFGGIRSGIDRRRFTISSPGMAIRQLGGEASDSLRAPQAMTRLISRHGAVRRLPEALSCPSGMPTFRLDLRYGAAPHGRGPWPLTPKLADWMPASRLAAGRPLSWPGSIDL